MHSTIAASTVPWWQAVFLNGVGSSVIGGLVAFLIAWRTVTWKRRDDDRLDILRRSREAAGQMLLSLVDLGAVISLYRPENRQKIDALFRQATINAPLLEDSARTVHERFIQLTQNIADLAFWRSSFDDDPSRFGPEGWETTYQEATICVQTQVRTVYVWLAAHATGKTQPDGEFPSMPALPDSVDRAANPPES